MDDFSPAAIARKVEGLNKLLTARTELSNLLTYMDGKTGAEELINKALQDPALLQSLASAPKPQRRKPRVGGLEPCRKPSSAPAHQAPSPAKAATSPPWLNREFKPKSDAARDAVNTAVLTLAQQALANTTLISNDALRSIEAIIGRDRRQADRADQPHPAQRGFPAVGIRLARACTTSSTTLRPTRC